MNPRWSVRAVAMAALVGVAIVSTPTAPAQAARANFSQALACELNGHQWSDTQGCADKSCQWFGQTLPPGETVRMRLPDGRCQYYMCDGFTGRMERFAITRPPGSRQPSQAPTVNRR